MLSAIPPATALADSRPAAERTALACFELVLGHIRYGEVAALACRLPRPERVASFTQRGTAAAERRFEALYGGPALVSLRQRLDGLLARVQAEPPFCEHVARTLAAQEESLRSPQGASEADTLIAGLGTMVGRPVPNAMRCEWRTAWFRQAQLHRHVEGAGRGRRRS